MCEDVADFANRVSKFHHPGTSYYRFLVYGDGTGIHVEVNYEGDQLWMTQAQIADLYGRDVSTISRHIASILEEGELDEGTSLQKAQTSHGRLTPFRLCRITHALSRIQCPATMTPLERDDLDQRLAAVEAELERDHYEGYFDGRDPECPEPNENRSAAYKHSFAVARAELANKVIPAVISRINAQQIASAERVKVITGERY